MKSSVTLILGGARSGKSLRAEKLAEASGLPVTFIATAPKIEGDSEWQERIEKHRLRRKDEWKTVEEELDLPRVIDEASGKGALIFVDCLTLWLSNLLFADRDVEQGIAELCDVLSKSAGEVILVSNEVGMGLVPENELGRRFRDAQGRMNQNVAAVADRVEFVAAGLPLCLKGESK
ncbi:MAG: bifunctional adenosylcobinamide kinase/adenosylcobinamide-phosphate guanylyltransferase [Mariprofundaceae bacterium]